MAIGRNYLRTFFLGAQTAPGESRDGESASSRLTLQQGGLIHGPARLADGTHAPEASTSLQLVPNGKPGGGALDTPGDTIDLPTIEEQRDGNDLARWFVELEVRATELEQQLAQRNMELAEARERLLEMREERQTLARRLVKAQEQERARTAREVHDGLGQILTLMLLYSKEVEAAPEETRDEQVGVLRQLASEASQAARHVARGLRPAELETGGLIPAIEWLAKRTSDIHDLRVVVDGGAMDGRLPAEAETAVYRIVQEALNNVVKHSGASTASVYLVGGPDSFRLLIEDDGCGFDVSEVPHDPDSGMGLTNMKDRAVAVGGRIVIESSAGRGTTVLLEIP